MAATSIAATSLDSSLWFDSFSLLLTDLENLPPSSDDLPSSLVEKLKENHAWFLNTVTQFKPPSDASKAALNSEHVTVGKHKLSVKPQFRDLAFNLSSTVCLDEIQSYILVERSLDQKADIVDGPIQGFLHEIVLQYYTERQCLLKCARQMIIHGLNVGSAVKEGKAIWHEMSKLISDGLESKLVSILERQLSSSFPQQMDVDLFILWAEEILIECNLILDILFLLYYESFSTCCASKWKELCLLYKDMTTGSSNFIKLGVSAEACKYCYRAKIQMLLILIETLDFESLLQMIHDEIPFRDSSCVFSSSDILEMDSVISSFDIFETKEVGPLILAWAVFLCLVVSLPGKEEPNELAEVDHVGYVRQAFESASLSIFMEILRSDVLKDSDGPLAGYRSILRTFISAFIASYEINTQLEDDTFRLILTILCEIYRGEESLCVQFWDKGSIVDGPVRCLLCNLEAEFPYRTIELTRFLTALSEGSWPAECVYNFMEKSVGISSALEIDSDLLVGGASQVIETQLPLHVPAVDGLFIPSKTRGRILRMIDSKTALVRWEYKQSGMIVLLLRLAQMLELDGNEEALVVLDLFSRVVSFNTAVCFSMMNIGKSLRLQTNYGNEHLECGIWIDMVEVLCNLVRNLSPYSGSVLAMAMNVNILAKMMECSPSHVSAVVMKMNIFDLSLKSGMFGDCNNGLSSSGSWLLSGRLAKMLLIDCEHNSGCPLTISVLEFTEQLLEAGVENDFVHALVMFCLQYVFVNHEYWKYKVKQDRWNVTLKVLGVLKISIISIPYLKKLGGNIRDIILSDSSIHSMILRIICTTSSALEKLYVSRLYDWREIDGLQHAICSMLDILVNILSKFSEDDFSGLPVFYQALLSNSTKPLPVAEALASLVSYFQNPAIQVVATAALSKLCRAADRLQPYLSGNANFGLGGKQVMQLRYAIESIISQQPDRNEPLFEAVIELLTSAANHQPAFLAAIFAGEEIRAGLSKNNVDLNEKGSDSTSQALKSENAMYLVDMLVLYVEKNDALIKRNTRVLLSILNLMKALWEGAAQYIEILKAIRKSNKFWKQLSESVMLISRKEAPLLTNLSETEAQKYAYEYQCQSTALDIMALEIFLQKKLLHVKSLMRQIDQSLKGVGGNGTTVQVSTADQLEDILLSWADTSCLSTLLKSSAACFYDTNIYLQAKIAFALLASHMIGKLATGDAGSMSLSFIDEVTTLSTKLFNLPAFSELCAQYTQHGYSEGIHIKNLILNDLYYHLQGELEGRSIEHGPFKELSQFLSGSNLLQAYQKKSADFFSAGANNAYLFDLLRIQHDIGLHTWNNSEWKASIMIVENTLLYLQRANSMLLILGSRLPALRALITILTLNTGDLVNKQKSMLKRISRDKLLSCIENLCKELEATLGLLTAASDAPPQEVLNYVAAQAELLLCLVRHVDSGMPSSTCLVILKTCGFGVKKLRESRLSEVKLIIRFLLMLLHMGVDLSSHSISTSSTTDTESEISSEVVNCCLGVLPILCSCTEIPVQLNSLATIDLMIKRYLAPTTWLPIIQQHLQLQQLILKLHDQSCFESLPVIMRFLLTLASVRGGAEMIVASGFLSSLRVLFAGISDDCVANWVKPEKSAMLGAKIEKPQFIWGLGLAVLTETICSLGETSLRNEVVDNMISYFFSEKTYLIAYHLSAPDFPSDDHDKKRARAQKRKTSLSAFRETEHTLMLLCILSKHRNSWVKATKEMGSELRGRIIHLLAFISRSHRLGESSGPAPFFCAPISKEEIDYSKKPSFVNSRNGWFAAAALGYVPVASVSNENSQTAIVIKDQSNRNAESGKSTYFSDTVALQLYKITFLILKFLLLQAKDAAGRAEELGFIDLSCFPELPDPEILHCLQDQTIAIVTEVCENNKSKQVQPNAQAVCHLLLKIVEMTLYLEHCVSQICGIRPVMGRVEDFSKRIRFLVRATEGQTFLKSSMKNMKQIVSSVYPGLLQNEGIL